MLVSQIGMAHLRFDVFSMNKRMRYMPTGTFYSYWASRKKPKGGDLKGHFKKSLELLRIYFFEKKLGVSRFVALPLEILDKRKLRPWIFRNKRKLHPWRCWKVV